MIAQKAQGSFDGFDTWINNACTGCTADSKKSPSEDMRKLFEPNLWRLIYGSLEAVKHLKQRGGARCNVGSTVTERAIPLQGIYSASKHAVKGLTDAHSLEHGDEGAPVSVSLVKPGAIDTPITSNAKNYLEQQTHLVLPVNAPESDCLSRSA